MYFCSVEKIRDGSEKVMELYEGGKQNPEPEKYVPKAEKKVEIDEADLPF